MNLTYEDKIVGTIRPSTKKDCVHIGYFMREQDAMEMWSAFRYSPIEAALDSYKKAFISLTIEKDGKPIVMFGIMPKSMASGAMWLLSTNGIYKIGRIFVRNSKAWVSDMLEFYPHLWGMVDLRNTVSKRWLDYLGCKWGDIIPYGIDKMPFQYFEFKKE